MSTTDTNKAPVNVIGWIREASTAIDRVYGPQAQLPKEADAVIAAVADLIERERAMRDDLEYIIRRAMGHPDDNDSDRLRDLKHILATARLALANIQGGAA